MVKGHSFVIRAWFLFRNRMSCLPVSLSQFWCSRVFCWIYKVRAALNLSAKFATEHKADWCSHAASSTAASYSPPSYAQHYILIQLVLVRKKVSSCLPPNFCLAQEIHPWNPKQTVKSAKVGTQPRHFLGFLVFNCFFGHCICSFNKL